MDLRKCIKYCIETFTIEEATARIHQYIEDSLKLKEQEIKLKELLKQNQ